MNTPLLSIIIPVYNTLPYLDNCLNSIINQTFTDWEMIIVDDGSTDGSSVQCDNYSKNDNRIIVIHTENRGLSSARNSGMDLAKGKYITFVDSDDEITPETYCENIKILVDNPDIEVIQFPTFEGYPDGILSVFPDKKYSSNKEIQIAFLEHFTYVTASSVNKIYIREKVNKLRFLEGHLHEDYIFIDQLVQTINSLVISDKGCYRYYHRPSSITHTKKISRYLDLLNCDISRLERRYEFPEVHHLVLEQYVFVVRELQNIHYEFPQESLVDYFNKIKSLKPKASFLIKGFSIKDGAWYFAITFLGLRCFTFFYQLLLKRNSKHHAKIVK